MDKGKAAASGSPSDSKRKMTIANSPQRKGEREQLIEKARQVLPDELFQQIQRRTINHEEMIGEILSKNKDYIIVTNGNCPRISKFIEAGNWDMQEIEWGIARKVIFRQHDRTEWIKFPAMIRYLINKAVDQHNTCVICEIFSTIGWREEMKFFQPYQIWVFDSPQSFHLIHPDYKTDAINYKVYWMNSFIEVIREARELLNNFEDYFIMTDGRRVFATKNIFRGQYKGVNHMRTQEEIDKARTVLEKMAYYQDTMDVPKNFQWFANNMSKRGISKKVRKGRSETAPPPQ